MVKPHSRHFVVRTRWGAAQSGLQLHTTYDTINFILKHDLQNTATKHKMMILFDDESGDSLLWPTMGFFKDKLMTKSKFKPFLDEAYTTIQQSTNHRLWNMAIL